MLYAEIHNQGLPKHIDVRIAPAVSLEAGASTEPAGPEAKVAQKPLSERDLDQFLAKSPWPPQLYGAVKRIAFCESSWVPTAQGPTDDHGLMQVRFKNHTAKVDTPAMLYDPTVNLRVAHAVWLEARHGKFKHGFAPWYMSNKCHGYVPPTVAANIKKHKKGKTKQQAQAS